MTGASQRLPPAPPATLRITNGPHAQVHATVPAGRSTVGSASSNDIVLADATLAPAHFAIESTAGPRGGLRLFAVGGPLRLGELTVAVGGAVACGHRTVFAAGQTEFELIGAAAERQPPPRRAARQTGAGAVLACVMAALLLVPAHRLIDAKAEAATAMAAPPTGQPPREAPPPAIGEDLRRRLDSAGLPSITLTAMPDASVEARGEIMPSQAAAWLDVQRWFDERFGGQAVLVDLVSATGAAPPLAIQAAWPGPNPYIIDGGGQKLLPGALLPGGWTLERVEADRAVIRRGAQTLAVGF